MQVSKGIHTRGFSLSQNPRQRWGAEQHCAKQYETVFLHDIESNFVRINQIGQFQLYEVIISFINEPRDKALTARYLAWGLILSLVHPVRPRGPMMGGLMIPNCHASISPLECPIWRWWTRARVDRVSWRYADKNTTSVDSQNLCAWILRRSARIFREGGIDSNGPIFLQLSQAPCSVHIGTTSIACSIYVTSFCYTALQGPICIWGERSPIYRGGGLPLEKKRRKSIKHGSHAWRRQSIQ